MNARHRRLTEFCIRHARLVVVLFLIVCVGFGWITVATFAINTDTARLISAETPWRKAEIAFDAAFPSRTDLIVVVLDAGTPEAADEAAEKLAHGLAAKGAFLSVRRPDSGPFFDKYGLLLLGEAEFKSTISGIAAQQPFMSLFASDPGLGGVLEAVRLAMTGLSGGHAELNTMRRALDAISATIEAARAGPVRPLSWRTLLSEQAPSRLDLRRLVLVQPRLDFTALQPGASAIDLIRKTGRDLDLTSDNGISLRLTGPVPLADEEFGTVAEGAAINTLGTIFVVIFLLFAALRSWRLVSAVLFTLLAGLVITAGFGLVALREYNLISVAFAVLFVGLGVDFSIQLAVRYREIRLSTPALLPAIHQAVHEMARPLLLASTSTAIGFLAFLPTSFKGVSELGLIAGGGMMIAFATSMTLLPALLAVLSPPAETHEIRFTWLAGADHFIERNRRAILAVTGMLFLAGLPLLAALRFDSDPMNLRDAKVESVAAFLDLGRDSETSPMTLDVIASSSREAESLAGRISALPEVARVASIATFLPDAQESRLAAINDASILIDTILDPINPKVPRDRTAMLAEVAETRLALAKGISSLAPGTDPADTASLRRLDHALDVLADARPELYARIETGLTAGIEPMLRRLRTAFEAAPITLEDVPPEIRRDWVTGDGRARLEILPRDDMTNPDALRRFVKAVGAVAPNITGAPVTIVESGKTVVDSFLVAAVLALTMITVLLYAVLRRVQDVVVTLVPLVIAVLMSLQAAVLLEIPLNFANIIALPLMCGVSVAFHIYYVVAWRQGKTDVLASSLTRAVFFSALTTATAFGSLWLSSHPGTSSMGKLLTLSLFFTMLAAFVFVPAFLGRPPLQELQEPQKSE